MYPCSCYRAVNFDDLNFNQSALLATLGLRDLTLGKDTELNGVRAHVSKHKLM